MYDSILVPVDGSEPADAAVEEAAALAARFDATLSLLTVIEPTAMPVVETVPEHPDREMLGDELDRALDRAESAADDADVPCLTTIERGLPHEEIESYADDHDVDLVAMGTHGRTGARRFVLGSVTERVLRTSDVPVLTTRGETESGQVDSVLVPTDGSDCASEAATHALELADRYDATVHALSVVDTQALAAGYDAGAGLPRIVESLREEREDAVDAIRERAADRGLETETAVLEGSPERAIDEYIDDHDVDLVAMGTHGKSGLDRVILGSVAERTIRMSDVPVLAIPGGE